MRAELLKLALVVTCLSACLASNLYAVVSDNVNNNRFRVGTIQINQETGDVTNVTTNFVYSRFNFYHQDISTFDQNNGRYYFAADSVTAFIYGTDVKNKQPLPTLDIGAKAIKSLTFDEVNGRLYAIYTSPLGGAYLAAVSTETIEPILKIPAQFDRWDDCRTSIMRGAVNGRTNSITSLARYNPNHILTMLSWPSIRNLARLLDSDIIGTILGAGEEKINKQLFYYFLKISPITGKCQKLPITPPPGFVTAWSFDPSSDQLWMVAPTINGPHLASYNVKTGLQTPPVQVAWKSVPMSLAVSLNF